MWIKQLQLENFQSHKSTVLDLHPYFNVFVGTGNSGKSSLVRALSFILYGEWDKSWVRNNESFCRITLVTDSGTKVIREKGEKVNRYIVRELNKKEQVYENFGTHIPIEIEKVLQVFKAQIDANELLKLNISSQLDPLFLLSKTGSYKAKVFGKLSGAYYLDYVLREINKDKKNLSSEKHLREIESLDLQAQLVQYNGIEREQKKLVQIEQYIEQITRKIEFVQRLKKLLERVHAWKVLYATECEKERAISRISMEKLHGLFERVSKLTQLKTVFNSVQRLQQKEVNNLDLKNNLQLRKDKLVEEYFSLLQKHKICPTCFSSINDEKLTTIRSNLE